MIKVGDIGKSFKSKKLARLVKVTGLYRHVVTRETGVIFEDQETVVLHQMCAPLEWWHEQGFEEVQ